jgi:RsiW-degrading membrane proteinase PrsW (M82 family)
LVDSAHFAPLSYFESGHQFSLPKPPQVTKIKESFATAGLYNPEIYNEQLQRAQYYGIAGAIIVALILALIIISLTVYQLGPIVAIIATFVAFIPACFYILPLIWLDRYDPEPAWLLACAFGWGALVSIVGTFAVSIMAMTFLNLSFGRIAAAIFDLPFISAPIVEEGMKGLGLVFLLLFFRKHFDGIVDGIVYGGVIALGFATVENVLYYGDNLAKFGALGLAFNFVMRGILSPFAHVTFTAMTGIGCGLSRESYKWPVRISLPIVGYFAAVLLHGIWNFIASVFVAYYGIWGFLGGYAIVEFPFFILFVCFVGYTFFREKNILKKHLYVSMVKGVVTREQIDNVTSVFKGLSWLIEGLSNGKFMARHKFMRAVSKLGLAWWHVERAKTEQGETRSFGLIPALERDVLRWRNQI